MEMPLSNLVEFIGLLIAFCGIIASNIMIIRQIKRMEQQTEATKDQMGMEYKLNLRNKALSYSLYSNIHLRDARLRIEKYFGEKLRKRRSVSIEEIEALMEEEHIYSDIMTLLAHWENMALAIKWGVADKDIAFEMVGGPLTNHVDVFQSFIKDRRKRNKKAYIHLTELADDWRERLEPTVIQDEGIEPVISPRV